MSKYIETRTCTTKCRSNQHITDLNALISKTDDLQILLSAIQQCWNCHKMPDKYGRYLLHMAASCGRSKVCDWLIKHKKAELNLKTSENGFTPAHCACFYGNIDALAVLARNGANMTKMDFDRLNPLELLSLDKWLSTSYQPDIHDDFDIYCWGSNENFNLGFGHELKKVNPEMIDFFKRTNTTVIQVSVSKFHSVFRAKSGEVYTCGFGLDGRLGHDDEQTLMSPKLIEVLKNEKCIQVAAARSNSYFLMSDGSVYSCGTNEFKQLGQSPLAKSLTPKMINYCKKNRGKRIKQVECSRFHCVLLTEANEVLTFGLNAGQLGHLNETVTNNVKYNDMTMKIAEPRLVTALNEPDMDIESISCSDGCTVCLQSSKNILHVFSEFKCKRLYYIKETGSAFLKVKVYGGKLDSCSNPDLKWINELTEPLMIVGLTKENLLFIWREHDPVWRNLCWTNSKKIQIVDFDLNSHGVIICTIQGTCYRADFSKLKNFKQFSQQSSLNNVAFSPPSSSSSFKQQSSSSNTFQVKANRQGSSTEKFNATLKTEALDLVQIPYLNRCFRVVSDLKAQNFFALQYHPNTNMRNYPILMNSTFSSNMRDFFQEHSKKQTVKQSLAASDDYMSQYGDHFSMFENLEFNDVELKFNGWVYGLHKYVLLSRCPKFFSKFDMTSKAAKTPSKTTLELDTVLTQQKANPLQHFDLAIEYLYTNEFSEESISWALSQAKITTENQFIKFLNDFKEIVIDKFGFNELKSSFDPKNVTKNLKDIHLNNYDVEHRLDHMVKFMIRLLKTNNAQKVLRFSRNSLPELHDCHLDCNNNQSLRCHKCILIARSEYFQNMLLGSWIESNAARVQLPFDIDLVQIIVDYFYTDDIQMEFVHSNASSSSSVKSRVEREIEILFNLYVLSDQLIVERLKNLCEFKLANLINLKNIVEIFEFSNEYNAKQLKDFCMEFISNNLVTLIESKQLEFVNQDLLRELSKFYQSHFPLVGSRFITPYQEGPSPSEIDLVPLDLLYDQKFIDGYLDEESARKRPTGQSQASPPSDVTRPNSSLETQMEDKLIENPINSDESLLEASESTQPKETEPDQNISTNSQKWEKVRKKQRRKISEKELPKSNTQVPIGLSPSPSTPLLSKQVSMTNSLPEKQARAKNNSISISSPGQQPSLIDLKEPSPNEKETSESKSDSLVKPEPTVVEWPGLADTGVTKKGEMETATSSRKFPKFQSANKILKTARQETPKEAVIAKPSFAWGAPSANSAVVTPKSSLLDVMNEEMKKVSINATTKQEAKAKTQPAAPTAQFKGWNVSSLPTASPSLVLENAKLSTSSKPVNKTVDSFAQIIETEQKSKEHYKKLKNRPLHLIQLEEKAINDLRRYYCVESCTNMNIIIELIDETYEHLMTPFWAKTT